MEKTGYSAIVFFLVLLGPLFLHAQTNSDQPQIILEEDGEVQLRIDFTSGSKITNEPPVLLKHLPDFTIIEGDSSVLLFPLSDYFTDPENGARLKYTITIHDSSIISVKQVEQKLEIIPLPKNSGTTNVVVSASDDILHVTDTFTVDIKKQLIIKRPISDITLRKGQNSLYDIKFSRLFDNTYSYSEYSYNLSLSDNTVVSPSINTDKGRLELRANNADGICDIILTVVDPDSQSITDSFSVAVIKRSYDMNFDPGISLYTGLDFSGFESRFWIKRIIGFGIGVYTFWDTKGYGGDISLRGKLPLKSKLLPYITIAGGYHFQNVQKFKSNSQAESEISFPTFSAAIGAEVRLGKTTLHGFSIEAGYRYGTADFYYTSLSDPTIQDESLKENFTLDPLLIKLSYTFYFRGIANSDTTK